MSNLFFAADEAGGARMLRPVIDAVVSQGHACTTLVRGPAAAIWAGFDPLHTEEGGDFVAYMLDVQPEIVITGTSFCPALEPPLWKAAFVAGIPSIAVIDSWMNFSHRFPSQCIQPDLICVPDEWCQMEIENQKWCRASVCVTGHPHLEYIVRDLFAKRAASRLNRAKPDVIVTFFSEVVGNRLDRGYDQFDVAQRIVASLKPYQCAKLIVKPHPGEPIEPWKEWLNAQQQNDCDVSLLVGDAEQALISTDVVVGMNTMVLLEALLLGIPALSLQPDRTCIINNRLEGIPNLPIVTNTENIPHAIACLLNQESPTAALPNDIAQLCSRALDRMIKKIEQKIESNDTSGRSRKCFLRSFEASMITDEYLTWLNDSEFMEFSRQKNFNHTRDSAVKYIASFQGTSNLIRGIFDVATDELIGTITAYVNVGERSANIGIVLGRQGIGSRGYGSEAWGLMMNELFRNGLVDQVFGGTDENHAAMIRIFEKSGMEKYSDLPSKSSLYDGVVVHYHITLESWRARRAVDKRACVD